MGPARPQNVNPLLDARGNGPRVAEAIRLAQLKRPAGWLNPYGTADEVPEFRRQGIARGKHNDANRLLKRPANVAELAEGRGLELDGGHTQHYDMNTNYRLSCIRHRTSRIIVYSPQGPTTRKTGLPDTREGHEPQVFGAAYIEAFPRPAVGYPEERGLADLAGGHALG